MIRRLLLTIPLLAAAGLVWGADSTPKSRSETSHPDRSFGTAIQWEKRLDWAAKNADREHKLLLVLAVAGHFDDPFFT